MRKAHGKRMFSVFVLVFAVALSGSAALADFYVIPAGKRAKRTVLVSPQSTPAASGTALLNALNGITDSSLLNPYLIIIEPGVYDIGDDTLQMKYSVDIQGSGEDVTKITGNVDSNSSGVVQGEDNAELRFLTVENTGGGIHAFAIYNSSCSPRMTNVTARAYGGGSFNFGVYNSDYSSPTMTNVTVRVWGGWYSRGVLNLDHSNPTMTNVNAYAYSGTYNFGVWNISDSSPTMTNVTATASGGTTSYGVSNEASSNPTMTNVNATCWGGTTNYGVWNSDSSPTMTNVNATASGGTTSYGVYNYGSCEAKIDHSVISGSTNSVYTDTGSQAFIGNTRLEGGAVGGYGTNTCAGVYDESYTFYPSTCP